MISLWAGRKVLGLGFLLLMEKGTKNTHRLNGIDLSQKEHTSSTQF